MTRARARRRRRARQGRRARTGATWPTSTRRAPPTVSKCPGTIGHAHVPTVPSRVHHDRARIVDASVGCRRPAMLDRPVLTGDAIAATTALTRSARTTAVAPMSAPSMSATSTRARSAKRCRQPRGRDVEHLRRAGRRRCGIGTATRPALPPCRRDVPSTNAGTRCWCRSRRRSSTPAASRSRRRGTCRRHRARRRHAQPSRRTGSRPRRVSSADPCPDRRAARAPARPAIARSPIRPVSPRDDDRSAPASSAADGDPVHDADLRRVGSVPDRRVQTAHVLARPRVDDDARRCRHARISRQQAGAPGPRECQRRCGRRRARTGSRGRA